MGLQLPSCSYHYKMYKYKAADTQPEQPDIDVLCWACLLLIHQHKPCCCLHPRWACFKVYCTWTKVVALPTRPLSTTLFVCWP
jgi:hypothetical protein